MSHDCVCCIIPPHMLRRLADSPDHRDAALRTLALTERLRGSRDATELLPAGPVVAAKRRTIFDARHETMLPGVQVRDEGDRPSAKDIAVNEAYDYAGDTYEFFRQVFVRNSVDDRGLTLKSTVHFDVEYDNAFWNGRQMVYGDGDGTLFNRFTIALDVIAHELTHGVTQNEAQLVYRGQPGALNESISDVFGSLVKQWALNQTAHQADWLIGAGLFTPSVKGEAIRSMKAPGTAYDDPVLGADPQPADMRHYVTTRADNGGVHINSGIPNRAFYLASVNIGGYAWQKAGLIWYRALTTALGATADFQAAADETSAVAAALFGDRSIERQAVSDAWQTVGLTPCAPRQFTSMTAPPKGVAVADSF
jgi:Zn-dependent metalloprotease